MKTQRNKILYSIKRTKKTDLDLSNSDLSSIDLSSDAIRFELSRRNFPFSHPPLWYRVSPGGINLSGADFSNSNLSNALLWRGDFSKAKFISSNLENSDLGDSILENANFTNANLKNARLIRSKLNGACFIRTNLYNTDLRGVDLSNVKSFEGAYFCGVNLNDSSINRDQIKNCIGEEIDKDFIKAKEAYIALKNNFLSLGKYNDASWAYIKERQMDRKSNNPLQAKLYYGNLELNHPEKPISFESLLFNLRHFIKWITCWIDELICGYGEMPFRVITWTLIIIFLFSYLYFLSRGISNSSDIPLMKIDYLEYSLFSFSTMSLADIIAVNHIAKILTCIESILGICMLSLFMFTLGNRIEKH